MSVYLDYNASAPVHPEVLDAMIDVYRNCIGNSDSRTHNHGENARQVVEKARGQVASLLGVETTEVFFTSGATESNNIVIQGLESYALERGKKHIITSAIEHKSVLEAARAMSARGFDVDFLNPDRSGRVGANEVLAKVRPDTLLVSLMHVSNETGIIQPVTELGGELERRGVYFHVDATQSCGKLVEELRSTPYDMLSFSAHKLGGPQGVGVLVLRRKNFKLPPVKPILYGGQQERGIRPGTVPVALVCGCGVACAIAERDHEANQRKLQELKGVLLDVLAASGVKYLLNGDQEHCLPNTCNVCLPGVSSEALMIATKQYCSISNGSACTSRSYAPSYVLTAMGIPAELIESSVRISWGAETDPALFHDNLVALFDVAKQMAD